MEISQIRSSSYNCFNNICEFQYYLTYCLGIPSKSGKAANLGTFCHKVFECLALAKLTDQNNKNFITDPILGKIKIKSKNNHYLSNSFIDNIISIVYNYYKYQYDFDDKDKKLIIKWIYKVIDEGKFDPRTFTIIDVEKFFKIDIQKDWAKLDNGDYLSIIGTIDLVVDHSDCLEMIDWKTGKKINYGTMKEKTFDDFMKDFQGRLYHYALRYLYPDKKNILVTINYINSSPVTVAHDDSNIQITEDIIQKTLINIKKCKNPRLKSNNPSYFFCKNICSYGKNYIGNKTQCQHIKSLLDKVGMEQTTAKMREEGFTINDYQRG